MPPKPTPSDAPLTKTQQWVVDALAFSGITQSALAEELASRKVISKDRSIINKITKGVRDVKLDEAIAIAEITKLAPPLPADDGRLREIVQLYLQLEQADLRNRFVSAVQRAVQPQVQESNPSGLSADER